MICNNGTKGQQNCTNREGLEWVVLSSIHLSHCMLITLDYRCCRVLNGNRFCNECVWVCVCVLRFRHKLIQNKKKPESLLLDSRLKLLNWLWHPHKGYINDFGDKMYHKVYLKGNVEANYKYTKKHTHIQLIFPDSNNFEII